MKDFFQSMNIDSLNFALGTLAKKQEVISRNVANHDTPGFKADKLVFDEVMAEYFSGGSKLPLRVTNDKHLVPPSMVLTPSSFVRHQNNPSLRNDGNDVNLDFEMSELSSSGVMYQMLTQTTSNEFMRLRSAIQGR